MSWTEEQALASRATSWDYVEEWELKTNRGLGLLFDRDGVFRRGVNEVSDRVWAMWCVVQLVHGEVDRKSVLKCAKRNVGQEAFTDPEWSFVEGNDALGMSLGWRVEGMYALLWALRVMDPLNWERSADVSDFGLLPKITKGKAWRRFLDDRILRSAEEVLPALDRLLCLHWGLRDALINHRDVPGMNLMLWHGVVAERRQALEWLFSEERYDDVPMGT